MVDETHVITQNWTRKVKVMSDAPLDNHPLMLRTRFLSKRAWAEGDLFHAEIEYSVREPVRGFVMMNEKRDQHAVLWALDRGSIARGIGSASRGFRSFYKKLPVYAYVWNLPPNVDEGTVMSVDDFKVIVLSADWVQKGFVVIV